MQCLSSCATREPNVFYVIWVEFCRNGEQEVELCQRSGFRDILTKEHCFHWRCPQGVFGDGRGVWSERAVPSISPLFAVAEKRHFILEFGEEGGGCKQQKFALEAAKAALLLLLINQPQVGSQKFWLAPIGDAAEKKNLDKYSSEIQSTEIQVKQVVGNSSSIQCK